MVDVLALYLASLSAVLAARLPDGSSGYWIAACVPVLTPALVYVRANPDRLPYGSVLDTATYALGVVSLSALITIAAGSVLRAPRHVALGLWLWLFALVYLGSVRFLVLSMRRHALRAHAVGTPTLVVGAGAVGQRLARRLADDARYGSRPVGFLDADPPRCADASRSSPLQVLGGPGDLERAIAQTRARRIIFAFSSERDYALVDLVRKCQQLGLEVSIVPRLFESIDQRATLDHVGGLPLLSLRSTNERAWQLACKSALDRTLALVALLALAPLMLAIAAAVRVSSPGPVLFRQRRVGRDGRPFELLKFRTMYESDGPGQFDPPTGLAPGGVEGEDRRTRLGRSLRRASLDELPQLLSVLRGDMSLVGPRPERPEFVERFVAEVNRYEERHRVKSGITGWAQVNGLRGQTSIADRVEWDNYYIRNWSIRLDLRIILLTIAEVLRFRG